MLTRDEVKKYILNKPGAYEDFPFGDDTPVFKVGSRMFSLINKDKKELRINLKSDPDDAIYLRDNFDAIIPGYHMHKRHWNTVIVDNRLPDGMVKDLIDKSYELVYNKLKKDEKEQIKKI
ncbi:DNA-binding protein [Vallitalea longa]|uniref:DNA-binding protein n=1 Tax=Vallitalea longa TaxID=2936439 RepID=A0A9W5Y9V2_9FIRM|nr:MmcQ/YjbR family DNA-binding protein [Vallitalea longa]GKX29547.1 DNA-binding protein [Vallitalea longa]